VGSGPGVRLQEHFRAFLARRVVVSCPHPVGVCIERMRADLMPPEKQLQDQERMRGAVIMTRFVLKRGTRSGFTGGAVGRFEPDGRGTSLHLRFGWGWLEVGLATFDLAITVVAVERAVSGGTSPAWPSWLLAGALAIPFVWSIFRGTSSVQDNDWLVAHLCEVLDGAVVPGPLT
jgi:hypothetical protein